MSMGSVVMSPLSFLILVICILFFFFSSLTRGLLGFPSASVVENLPAKQETWVPSLGWKDPLEKGLATHSRILA